MKRWKMPTFFALTRETKQGQVDEQPNNEEEHGTIDDNIDHNTEKTREDKMNNQTKQSNGDLKTQLNFIIFPEEGECQPAWIGKTTYKISYLFIYHLCFDTI